MDSGAGNAPGFEKRRNAVSGCEDYQGNDDRELAGPDGSRVACDPKHRDRRKTEENEAQNFVPERMDGLYGRGENVLDELPGLPGQMLLGHYLILSKTRLVPANTRLYNQGNICPERSGNRWPCSCITAVGNSPVGQGPMK